jgi:hypothetical protein
MIGGILSLFNVEIELVDEISKKTGRLRAVISTI